jgi:FKBP-type peptidyl-prolyl cis-trans isomerase FkpA
MSTVTAVPLQPVRRRVLVYLWLGIALAVIIAVALAWQAPRDQAAVEIARISRGDASIQQTSSGLLYKVLTPGSGAPHPTDEDVALINYTGKLLDGTPFDASQRPTPMPVAAADPDAGRQGIIKGLSEGLKMMPKGAKYRFWIKPSLAYGEKAMGPIPVHAALMFDVEMLDWKSLKEIQQMQQMQQMMQQQGGAPAGAAPPPGAQ